MPEKCPREIVKGQIIVPKSMRAEIRAFLHQGHPGIEKCKSRARQAVYWPGITRKLTDLSSLHGRDYLIVVDYHSKFFEVTYIQYPA